MAWIKKTLMLHHECSKNMECFLLGSCLLIPCEFMLFYLLGNDKSGTKLLSLANSSFYILAIIVLFLFSAGLNLMDLRMHTFFRVSRRKYYISLVVYLAIISLLLSFIHILLNEALLIFFNYGNISFMFSALLFFSLAVMFNALYMVFEFYDQRFIVLFIAVAIILYPLKVYSYIVVFLQKGNPLLICFSLILICIISIYGGWLLLKKVDVQDNHVMHNNVSVKPKKRPFEKNYFKFIINYIPANIVTFIIVLLVFDLTKWVHINTELVLGLITGSLIYDSLYYVYCYRKNRKVNNAA